MNITVRLLSLVAVYSLASSVLSDPIEQPLIFQTKTLEIYRNWQSMPMNGGPYAIACPAKGYAEEQFDQKKSLDHKSLFVRDYSKLKTEHIKDMFCHNYFKLAAVFHLESGEKLIEFGYEVYIDVSQFGQQFKTSDFNEFGVLLAPGTLFNRARSFIANLGNALTIEKKEQTNSGSSTKNQKLDFTWLSRAVLKYDFSKWNVLKLTYFITRDANQLEKQCTDNNLGAQFFEKNEPNVFYEPSAQKKAFKMVTLPNDILKDESDCKLEQHCVKQYNLLWPYQYQSASTESLSCSELTTIPVWYETAEEPLNYSEKFLIAVVKVANKRLKITAGTYETLTFPRKKDDQPQEMCLRIFYPDNKIPIPKIIYKVVKYKSHDCNTEEEICWFDMVIVIHNQPQVLPEDIICQDKSQEWGWQSIRFGSTSNRNKETKSKFIYVCELDEATQDKLAYVNDTPKKGNLKLNHFPSYNEDEHKMEFLNWQEKFEVKMDELFGQSSLDPNRSEVQ